MISSEFVEKCIGIAKNYKTTYIWGGIGQPITAASCNSFVAMYSKNADKGYAAKARTLIGQNAFAFDCVGLMKSVAWGWSGAFNKTYGGAVYASNGVKDLSADGTIAVCSSVSSVFDKNTMVPGEALWCSGHIGVYIGDGLGVEATPSFNGGVQITAVGNIGAKDGYSTRNWTKHGRLPYITYDAVQNTAVSSPTTISSAAVAVRTSTWKSGKFVEIPTSQIDHICHIPMASAGGEYLTYAAKRFKWNNRFPDYIINAELFNMTTYAPASGVKQCGKVELAGWQPGVGFKDYKDVVWENYNAITSQDWVGGYPALVKNGVKNFTVPAGLSGSRYRTAIGVKDGYIALLVTQSGATLDEVANKFISDGYTEVANFDGGGSSAYATPESYFAQSRKLRGFVGVWVKNGRGNVCGGNNPQTTTEIASTTVSQSPSTSVVKTLNYLRDTTIKSVATLVTTASSLNFRDENGNILKTLPFGTRLKWEGFFPTNFGMSGKWYYVSTLDGSTNGLVSAAYVKRA